MLNIKYARVSGFCGDNGEFGVSGAIRLAQEAALSDSGRVYLVGDLVHNQHVTSWLQSSYGIKFVSSLDRVPPNSVVVIKAHGAPPAFFAAAAAKKCRIVDATCPMVKASQLLVRQLVASGHQIIYVASDKKHDEALSVTQQVPKGVRLVTLGELDNLVIKDPAHTVVLTQTTLSMLETQAKFARLQQKYPNLTIRPHLCQATTARQQAVLDLAPTVDLLLVVGAPHSSNSQRLLEVAQSTGKPAYAVNEADDINPDWFDPTIFTVGVIAGASTPTWVTSEVVARLHALPALRPPLTAAAPSPSPTPLPPPMFLSGLGQDSHALIAADDNQRLYLAGLPFDCGLTFAANSDGDVILHAVCNALSSALGGGSFSAVADPLCTQGITDSRAYLAVFLQQVASRNYRVRQASISVEAARPQLEPYRSSLQQSLSQLLLLPPEAVGLTFTSGENLTAVGRGDGMAVTANLLLEYK